MRRTLVAPVAVAVLAACAGPGEEPPGSAATSPAAGSGFCMAAVGIQARITAALGGETDRSILPEVLQEAAAEIGTTRPPDELAADWTAFAEGITRIAGAAQVDFDDPAAVAAFQREVAAAQQQYGSAFGSVRSYLGEECGLVEESAAPPS